MPFDIIAAFKADDGGIGKDGGIPWNIKADMKHFREITTKTQNHDMCNAIIMGRGTWESIGCKPLANRVNIVISTSSRHYPGAFVFPSLQMALNFTAMESDMIENTFVIGGEKVYQEAIGHRELRTVYVTRVYLGMNDIACDRFFPVSKLSSLEIVNTSDLYSEGDVSFTFSEYIGAC